MDTEWLTAEEQAAWVRLAALVELLPGVLDSQLRRDSNLTHFEYFAMAMLSEAPRQTLRLTELAAQTNATLSRLSHVVSRLEDRDLLVRFPCPEDARATNVRLTSAGRTMVKRAAPGHVVNVREHVMDALTPRQVRQLTVIAEAVLGRLDPDEKMTSMYHRYDKD